VIIVAVNVNAVDIADADCDRIIQCDAYGSSWSSGELVCDGAGQNSPDTEEVILTDIRITNYCNSSDTASDCMNFGLNFYEELSSNDVYHWDGINRFGEITFCCNFGEYTASKYGFINDFNSDRNNPISREWSIIDINDNEYDSCPTTTYNPQDITQTTDLSTFNISFLPLNHIYDQYVEPQFGEATIWALQDYYLRNVTDTYNYADTIKEYVQDYSGQNSWDTYDLFGFGNTNDISDVLNNDIEYIKDSCTVYEMSGCTSSTSTDFSCTANTGVNIKSDIKAFLNAFFEKYKTPLLMRLGHTWNYGSTLSKSFTGNYYWETAIGIKDSNILTYQGMRQFTNRTISRIQSDWTINNYDAVFVVCNNDADIRVVMSETDNLGSHTYDYDTNLNQFDLIKGEKYSFGALNDEANVVTTDSLFRYDFTNDGTWDIDWDDQIEVEGFLPNIINTSVATSELTLDAETWGKGGTNSILTKYRVYNNPYLGFASDFDNEGIISDTININALGDEFYDIGDMDYYCIDFTSDGTYDLIYRKSSSTYYNCSTDVFSIVNTDSNLYDNSIDVSSTDYLQTPGSYTLSLKGGINLVNSNNYSVVVTYPVTWNSPVNNPSITLKSSSWNTYSGDTLIFDVSDTNYQNEIDTICYDYDYGTGYDQCVSKDGTNDCGLPSCFIDTNPKTYNMGFGITDYNSHEIYAKVWDVYNFSGIDLQTYQFRLPIISPVINWLSSNDDVIKDDQITFNTIGSISENSIYSICMDIDNDGSNEQCETLTSTTFTIDYSDVNDFNTHNVAITIIDDSSFSEEIVSTFSFRDYYNTAKIRRVLGSVSIGDVVNETGWLIYDGALSVVDYIHYTCYDYTNNGTYDKCYSVNSGETHCGISCDYTPIPLNGIVNLSYSVVNKFGDFDLKLLVNNDNTDSINLYKYGFYLDSPETWFLPKITSTNIDDDTNDDFFIDSRDVDLTEDIPENKTWFFEWTALGSTYLYKPEFSCWGNSITGSFDTCYQVGGGYNRFCGINCTDYPWWSTYSINSSLPYDKDFGYGVTLIIGDLEKGIAGSITEDFRFNPSVQEDIDTMRGFIIVAITIIIIFVLTLGGLFLTGFIIFSLIFGFIFRRFFKKKKTKDNEIDS
jgi:hypothetical protein